jgi:hypothetical protein
LLSCAALADAGSGAGTVVDVDIGKEAINLGLLRSFLRVFDMAIGGITKPFLMLAVAETLESLVREICCGMGGMTPTPA